MSDQGFHELQLSRKQLVFLFMSALVLIVVVFLLGVSVGKGVKAGGPIGLASSEAAAAGDTKVPGAMPPATLTTPNELDYHERLQGRGQPPDPKNEPQAKPAEPPSPPGESVGAPPKTAAPAVSPAAGSATKPPVTSAASASPPASWSVQVMAFKSKDLADALVVKLKSRGYSAFIFNSPAPGVPYHVRVGPFAQRDEAVRTVDKLAKEKEGYKTSVIR